MTSAHGWKASVAAVAVVPLVLVLPAAVPASAAPQPTAAVRASAEPRPTAALPGEALADDLIVVGHRGASGYRPEHTLASYELAARMGADYIEPDVVSTKDHVLVTRHENEISGTTDVAARPEFADRRTTKVIDGAPFTGWFTEDFTLAELRTLRAVERLPDVREENTLYNGLYQVPTLDEVLDLRDRLSQELDREVGVYIETKHPTYFDVVGLSLEEPLLADLRQAHMDGQKAPVFIQSFETANLRELDREGVRVPLVQLMTAVGAPYDFVAAGDPRTYAELSSAAGLRAIAAYADGVGPEKNQVIPALPDGTLGARTAFVDDAHAAGLLVHPFTFRNENTFLPPVLREGPLPDDYGQALVEQAVYWEAGIDGMFTDNPDTGVVSRELFLTTVQPVF
jgi:glycerophosphoryl diester phosphodiesterase